MVNDEENVEESASGLPVLMVETATDDVWKAAAAKVVLMEEVVKVVEAKAVAMVEKVEIVEATVMEEGLWVTHKYTVGR